jgi:hypothetical protein
MSNEVNQMLHLGATKPLKPNKKVKSFPAKPQRQPKQIQSQTKKGQSQTQSVIINLGGKKGRKSSAPAPPPPNRFPMNFPVGFNPSNPNLWYAPPPPALSSRQFAVFPEGETSRNLGLNSNIPVKLTLLTESLKPPQSAAVLTDKPAPQIFEPPPEVAFEEPEQKEELAVPVSSSTAPLAESYAFPSADEIEAARIAAESQPPVLLDTTFGVEKGTSSAGVGKPKKYSTGEEYVEPESRNPSFVYDNYGYQIFNLDGTPRRRRQKAKAEPVTVFQAPFGAEPSASFPSFPLDVNPVTFGAQPSASFPLDVKPVAANPLGPLRVPAGTFPFVSESRADPSTGFAFLGAAEEPKKPRNPLERGRGSDESRGRAASLGPLSSRSSAGSGISPSENLLFT